MWCKPYSSASKSMSTRSDADWVYPGLLLIVLASLLWPPVGALLVIVGAALTVWRG